MQRISQKSPPLKCTRVTCIHYMCQFYTMCSRRIVSAHFQRSSRASFTIHNVATTSGGWPACCCDVSFRLCNCGFILITNSILTCLIDRNSEELHSTQKTRLIICLFTWPTFISKIQRPMSEYLVIWVMKEPWPYVCTCGREWSLGEITIAVCKTFCNLKRLDSFDQITLLGRQDYLYTGDASWWSPTYIYICMSGPRPSVSPALVRSPSRSYR